jgi:hypothetical protein
VVLSADGVAREGLERRQPGIVTMHARVTDTPANSIGLYVLNFGNLKSGTTTECLRGHLSFDLGVTGNEKNVAAEWGSKGN